MDKGYDDSYMYVYVSQKIILSDFDRYCNGVMSQDFDFSFLFSLQRNIES